MAAEQAKRVGSASWTVTSAVLVRIARADRDPEEFHGLVVLATLLGIQAFIIALVAM